MYQLALRYLNHAGEEHSHLLTGFHDAGSCEAVRKILLHMLVMVHDSRILESACIAPQATTGWLT